MSANNNLTLAILAAGRSRRFGDEDKLTKPLGGKMLGLHVAEALAPMNFAHRVIITQGDGHACWTTWTRLVYDRMVNNIAAQGQATSVRLAARQAEKDQTTGLCICLADMPFVTAEHVGNLVEIFERLGQTKTVASASNGRPMPPAIFPKSLLSELVKLEGDHGAKSLLKKAALVHVSDSILMDIDTEADLEVAQHRF